MQQVILVCTITLEIKSSGIMLYLDSKNALTFCNRDKPKGELEIHVVYHYILIMYKAMYGKTVIVQCHFGNGPDR